MMLDCYLKALTRQVKQISVVKVRDKILREKEVIPALVKNT